ncbi:MAG: hypothetical protein R2795_17810 [Saprospiraceae bacterium]
MRLQTNSLLKEDESLVLLMTTPAGEARTIVRPVPKRRWIC